VERDGKVFAFALNIDMPASSDGVKRVTIGKAILGKLGIF
jgi:beta-lactamase class D